MKFKMFLIAVASLAVWLVLVRREPTAAMKRAVDRLKPLAAKY